MTDEEVVKIIQKELKDSDFELHQDRIFPWAPSFISDLPRKMAILVKKSDGSSKHIKIMVNAKKPAVVADIKKAIK